MKGFVPTPARVVDLMVDLLFRGMPPTREKALLDPGCGTGAFIEGVLRWCQRKGASIPDIVGVDSDSRHVTIAKHKFEGHSAVTIRKQDFLKAKPELYDFVIGNPPYVPITGLTATEKTDYRRRFATAVERFDLYLLFFEHALKALKPDGRLVFITPEKFIYVSTASPLRRLLAAREIEEIRLIEEDTFANFVTYPTITAATGRPATGTTKVILRDGRVARVHLSKDGGSWLPLIERRRAPTPAYLVLEEVCDRISCGVATGADSVFVKAAASLDPVLRSFAYPTIAGRELTSICRAPRSRNVMLVPYRPDGALIPEVELGPLRSYLEEPTIKSRLLARTCVARKPWYAFHENPPLREILRPKILCKDIANKPDFWIDSNGELVPRHSVYYIIPKDSRIIERLSDYLNSKPAHEWLRANCQRASNGFLRLQSHILKRLPIPRDFAYPLHIPIQVYQTTDKGIASSVGSISTL